MAHGLSIGPQPLVAEYPTLSSSPSPVANNNTLGDSDNLTVRIQHTIIPVQSSITILGQKSRTTQPQIKQLTHHGQ